MAPLAAAVVAPGQVKAAAKRKTVQHFEGGIVTDILVSDGDRVQAGRPLVVVVDERSNAGFDRLMGQLDAASARAARLRAERDGALQPMLSERLRQRRTDADVDALLRVEADAFQTRRLNLEHELELLADQRSEVQVEIEALDAQRQAHVAARRFLAKEVAANETLERAHAVSAVAVLALKRQLHEHHARDGAIRADIATARQRDLALQLRALGARNRYAQSAAEELTAINAKIFELEARVRPLRDAVRRQVVVAPITGTVVNLQLATIGAVVRPGEPLLDIVPDDEHFIIEIRIDVDDIESVQPGAVADIRLTAFNVRTSSLLAGTLTYVSADRLTDARTDTPYYEGHVRVDPLPPDVGGDRQLRPGMRAEVFLKAGTRTAMDYVLAPVAQTLRRALRDP